MNLTCIFYKYNNCKSNLLQTFHDIKNKGKKNNDFHVLNKVSARCMEHDIIAIYTNQHHDGKTFCIRKKSKFNHALIMRRTFLLIDYPYRIFYCNPFYIKHIWDCQ